MKECLECGKTFDETVDKNGKKFPATRKRLYCSTLHKNRRIRRLKYQSRLKPKHCKFCNIEIPRIQQYCKIKSCQTKAKNATVHRYRKNHPEWYQEQLRKRVECKKERPEHFNHINCMSSLKKRMQVFQIIGAVCRNCKDPSRVPQIDHISEVGHWSGREHRSRVGAAGVVTDLLRQHRAGKDIRTIVQPLCQPCNMQKYIRFRADGGNNGSKDFSVEYVQA